MFAGLCVASVVIWLHPLSETVRLAISDERYTHLLLIIPLTVALIALQWNVAKTSVTISNWGGTLMAAGLLCYLEPLPTRASADIRLTIIMFGLVLCWLGAFLLCFGAERFRSMLLPLLMLFWIVPLPALVLDSVVSFLQKSSAVSAEVLFRAVTTPVSLHASVLSLPGLELEVAPECSSIRSSLFLIVITMAVAQILLRSPWRKLAVILASLPLSFLKNGLRIFVLGWLAAHGDPGILNSRLHHQGGVVFLGIALAIVFLLVWVLRRGEAHAPHSRDDISAERARRTWNDSKRTAL